MVAFGKLLSSLCPFPVEEMGNSWLNSKHNLTSQVTPSEPPHSLTKRKLLLLLKPGRYGGVWQLLHGTNKEKESGVRVIGKDLNPRSAAHFSCITFSPFLAKHVTHLTCNASLVQLEAKLCQCHRRAGNSNVSG